MTASNQTKRGLQWPQSLTTTFMVSGAAFLGPVWLSWPRAFVALSVGLLPVVWSLYLLFHSRTKMDWIVSGISGVAGLFWLAMSGNLIWVMIRALYDHG
jgi:hypothetical protein